MYKSRLVFLVHLFLHSSDVCQNNDNYDVKNFSLSFLALLYFIMDAHITYKMHLRCFYGMRCTLSLSYLKTKSFFQDHFKSLNGYRNTVISTIPRKYIKAEIFHHMLHVLHGISFNLKYVLLLIHQKITFYHSLVYMNIYILKETWRNAAGLRHKNICAIYYLARNYTIHKKLNFLRPFHFIDQHIISFEERQKHAHQINPCWRKFIHQQIYLKINYHNSNMFRKIRIKMKSWYLRKIKNHEG